MQIKKTSFFELLKQYKEKEKFDIYTPRINKDKKISEKLENIILEELEKEQKLIQ